MNYLSKIPLNNFIEIINKNYVNKYEITEKIDNFFIKKKLIITIIAKQAVLMNFQTIHCKLLS